MSVVYIAENGAIIGTEDNRLIIKYKDGLLRSFPIETIDGISLLGKAQLTTQCVEKCLNNGISVSFFSKGGKYFGRIMSTGHVKAERQRKQSTLYDTDFALELSREFVDAKINNQIIVLRRYARNHSVNVDDYVKNMNNSRKKIEYVKNSSELIGYEGAAARSYFEGLNKCINPEFRFRGRSRRPPMDEFNSLISLGYSILMNEFYCEIENHGLNPYFGFLHRDSENHPTLASDLMEEWRAVIVDSTAMSMINGNEVQKDDFIMNIDEPGCFLTKECLTKFIGKLDEKLRTKTKYFECVEYSISFRSAIAMQIEKLASAIENEDAALYSSIRIR